MGIFLRSKIGTGILAGVLIVVAVVVGKLLIQKYQVDRQIKQLQARADQIKNENEQLGDLVKYLDTPQYKEKAAREQLNLKKDGEFVVALPQNQQEQVAAASTAVDSGKPEKWYNYFFHPEDHGQ